MNKQFNDDEIIKLYQHNNDALPPKEVDQIILARAAQAVEPESRKVSVTPRRYWHVSGIAAAMVAIIIFAPWRYFQAPELTSMDMSDSTPMPNNARTEYQAPSVEAIEISAEKTPKEAMEISGARFERAAPEQRTRKISAEPINTLTHEHESIHPFKDIITKLEAQDNTGAESALIELLQTKPELHEEVPPLLNPLYQALLKSGKLKKPEK